MRKFNFKKIDAFATENSSGNPAGYILLDSLKDISEREMLQIAQELKGFVNEVGYVAQVNDSEFDLRYYSAEKEVDFCGHATIAILYDIIQTHPALANIPVLIINTNKGKLEVENKVAAENSVFIMAPNPVFYHSVPEIDSLCQHLNIKASVINRNYPLSVIDAGLTTLLVPIKDLNSILSIEPELDVLKEFCIQSKIDIIEVFTSDVYDKVNDFRTRVFAPTFGYIEDPATGSGNSALGYYLIQNKLWNKQMISIEQNGERAHFNSVKLKGKMDDHHVLRVCFGGGAITRIEGNYYTYNS